MKIYFIGLMLFIAACNSKNDGKIIKRGSNCREAKGFDEWETGKEAQCQYLVNTSDSHIITFTIKTQSTSRRDNWGNRIYHIDNKSDTKTYKLNPGEELELEPEELLYRRDNEQWDKYQYEIVGAVIEK